MDSKFHVLTHDAVRLIVGELVGIIHLMYTLGKALTALASSELKLDSTSLFISNVFYCDPCGDTLELLELNSLSYMVMLQSRSLVRQNTVLLLFLFPF